MLKYYTAKTMKKGVCNGQFFGCNNSEAEKGAV